MYRNNALVSCLYFLIVLLTITGAISPSYTLTALLCIILLGLILASTSVNNSGPLYVKSLVTLLCFQNLCIGIGAHLAGNQSNTLSYLTQIPFILITLQWVAVTITRLYRRELHSPTDKLFFLLLLCIFLSLLVNRGSLQSIAVTARNLTVFYMAFSLGQYHLKTKESLFDFFKFLILISLFMIFAGEILILGGYPLHKILGVHEVYIAKGAPFPPGQLDGRFYTTLISGQHFRMGSLYFEPINLAYLLSASFIVSYYAPIYKNNLNKYLVTFILGIGLLQTVGKGGYLITALTFICIALESLYRVRNIKIQVFILTIGTLVTTLGMYLYVYFIGAAVLPHFWGITQTWENILHRPWGYGFGIGGNAAQILNKATTADEWFGSGGETALMSFAYQIGIQGVVVFILCVLSTSVTSNKRLFKWSRVFCYLPFILLGVSLMQDNTFTPQCICVFMFIQGSIKQIVQKELAESSL